jgi:hypothetical protein
LILTVNLIKVLNFILIVIYTIIDLICETIEFLRALLLWRRSPFWAKYIHDGMFIEDSVRWFYYDVTLENSDIMLVSVCSSLWTIKLTLSIFTFVTFLTPNEYWFK